jgi:3-oxoadipate enol-lactonase
MTISDTAGGGCRLRYIVDGRADAPALLLLNPLGTTTDVWAPQVSAFAARYRVIRYDVRGHGTSDVPAGDYTIEQLARDAIAVLDAAGVNRAHVCGLSIGGLTAMWLGVNEPSRVASLVLASTAARIGTRAGWDERIQQVRTSGLAAIADSAMGRWFTEPFLTAQPHTVALFRDMVASSPPDGYAGCCAALREADLRADLPRIARPALVISGAHDPATTPADGGAVTAAIVGARMLTFEAAHLLNVECAQPFNESVLTFVRAHDCNR